MQKLSTILALVATTWLCITDVIHAAPISISEDACEIREATYTMVIPDDKPNTQSLTTLLDFVGCSESDKAAVNEAFADAIEIAASVAYSINDIDIMDQYQYVNQVWWGKYDPINNNGDEVSWNQIKENLKRMRAMRDHGPFGDAFLARYFQIRCRNQNDLLNNLGQGCNKGSMGPQSDPSAHVVLKHTNGNAFDTICLCDDWFDNQVSFREKVARMDDTSVCAQDNLLSLKSKGSMLLHEILHTQYNIWENQAGVTYPIATDVELLGYPGKAYDAAKAKYVAAYVGMALTTINVDNYVYFALWHYVLNRWQVEAYNPPRSWRKTPVEIEMDYPDFIDGDNTLPPESYIGYVNETLIDTGGRVDYGGKPCSVDSDCYGTCPLEFATTCDVWGDYTCICGFTYDPPEE